MMRCKGGSITEKETLELRPDLWRGAPPEGRKEERKEIIILITIAKINETLTTEQVVF